MAAGDVTGVYTAAKKAMLDGSFNFASANLKVLLINAYTFSAAHATMTTLIAAGTENSNGGYTARGQAVNGTPVTATTGTVARLTITTGTTVVSWTLASGTTPSHAILYNDTGANGTSIPILAWELGATVPPNGGTYSLTTVVANGMLQVS